MSEALSLATLGELSHGQARAVIDAAIGIAVRDTEDRGHDGKPRTVTITLTMKKVEGNQVVLQVEADQKLPKLRTAPTMCAPRLANGRTQLMFEPLSPEDPRQRTISEREDD